MRSTHAVALPAVDDPQARAPGTTSSAPRAASAAAGASPGAPSASTSPKRWPRSAPPTAHPPPSRSYAMKTIADLIAEQGFFAGLGPGQPRVRRGLRRATSISRPATGSSPRGRPGATPSTSCAAAASPSSSSCRAGGGVDHRHPERRRRAGLVVALRAVPLAVRRRGARGRGRASAFDGACLRSKCDADPRLGYMLMQRLRPGDAGAAPVPSACGLLDVYGRLATRR